MKKTVSAILLTGVFAAMPAMVAAASQEEAKTEPSKEIVLNKTKSFFYKKEKRLCLNFYKCLFLYKFDNFPSDIIRGKSQFFIKDLIWRRITKMVQPIHFALTAHQREQSRRQTGRQPKHRQPGRYYRVSIL